VVDAVGIIVCGVFAALAGLHLYWAAGGRFGADVTVPTVDGKASFTPSPTATVIVAGAFILAMIVVLGRIGALDDLAPEWLFRWGTWAIALVFLLRAIGEFNLVGFFKRVRNTQFARWDTFVYSPLCVAIAAMMAIVGGTAD